MMTASATTDVTRENAIILLHFEFNWFIEHDFEWFFLWTIMLSLILMLSLYFRLFIVFFEKVAEIDLNLNLNLITWNVLSLITGWKPIAVFWNIMCITGETSEELVLRFRPINSLIVLYIVKSKSEKVQSKYAQDIVLMVNSWFTVQCEFQKKIQSKIGLT